MFIVGAIIFMLLLAAAVLVKRRAKRSLSDDQRELIGSSEQNGWWLLVPAAVLGGALALTPHLIGKSRWLLPSLMVGVFAVAVGFSVSDVRRAARSGLPVDLYSLPSQPAFERDYGVGRAVSLARHVVMVLAMNSRLPLGR